MTRNLVCHLTSAHLPSDTRIFYKQCKTLARASYQVSLIAQNDRDEERDGIHIKGISRPRNRLDRMLNLARQVYRRAVECDADIYHFHDPELIPVGLRLKRQGKKVIYDVHEDVPRQILSKSWIAEPLRRAISWTVEKLEDYAASRFDAIVTATEYIAKRFRELNGNVVAIHNYPINSDIVTDYSGLNKRRQICYISSHLSIERAIVPIVESMQYIDAELILAGRMTESVRMLVENLNGWGKTLYISSDCSNNNKCSSRAGIAIFFIRIQFYVNVLPN